MGEKSFVTDSLDGPGLNIETVRIDDFVAQNEITDLAIIHLDVGGYEREAIIGAAEAIRQFEPIIIVEEGSEIQYILPACYGKANFTVGHDHFVGDTKLRFQNMFYAPAVHKLARGFAS